MGTELGRGSLTGAAAAPACPSVKTRASAASSLPLPAFSLPFWAPPPAAPRAKAQAHLTPDGPPTPEPLGFHSSRQSASAELPSTGLRKRAAVAQAQG